MIFKSTDYFEKVFYCTFTGFKVGIITEKRYEELPEEKRKKYIKYVIKFKPLTWGEHGKMRSECHRTDPTTNQRIFDYDSYTVKKLTRVIEDWNLARKNEDGEMEKIEPNSKAIEKLHPLIATHILTLYEDEVEMTQEEEKN